jgi:hypothetical protein
MAKQTIDIGSQPNDGTGDSLREGAQKINSNFNEIYQSFGDGFNLSELTIGTATTAGFAQTAGIATNAQNLNGQSASFYLNYNNLNNLPTIPTNTNQLTNGAGYITTTALVGYATDGDLVGFQTAGNLVGFITNIQAGAGISVFESPAGNFIVTSTGGLVDIVGDTTPQLGGDLDLNTRTINGTGNIDISGQIDITGKLSVGGGATVTGTTFLDQLNAVGYSTFGGRVVFDEILEFRGLEAGGANALDWYDAGGVVRHSITYNGTDFAIGGGDSVKIDSTASGSVKITHGGVGVSTFSEDGLNVTGIVTATSFVGNGSGLTGIATDVGLAGVQAEVNALGTNLNIVGFYDAVAGVVTGLTLVGQARGISIGSTLAVSGINTGDYYIVSVGGTEVGIATYSRPGISSVYSGDWIVGIDTNAYSILSYSQQVVAPRATRSDFSDTLESNSSVNTSGIITAGSFDGSLAASNLTGALPAISGASLTNLTGASAGTFGDPYTVPTVTVDSNGRITGISTVSISGGALGGNRWSNHPSGISTSSSVGIGTTTITSTLTVKGDGIVDGAFQIGLDAATTATLNLTSNSSLSYGGNNLTLRNDRTSGRVVLMGDNGVEMLNHDTNARAAWFRSGIAYLYNEGNLKLQTTTGGIDVTGVVTATKFVGDGSGLIGVTASGTGIEVKDSGSVVGTAGTIDFGTGLDISPASAGIVTVTVNVGAADTASIVSTAATITDHLDLRDDNDDTKRIRIFHGRNIVFGDLQPITGDGALFNNNKGEIVFLNTENDQLVPLALKEQSVGIGTTNPLQALDVRGNALVSGILTATGGFSGSIDSANNLTGGIATATQLSVSGVTTISLGRIQSNADANIRFGNGALSGSVVRNIAIGDQVLQSMTGGSGRNIGMGEFALKNVSSGAYNVGLGIRAGEKINTGSYNVVLGGFNGDTTDLGIINSSNNVVISDGQGDIRFYSNGSKSTGINTTVLSNEDVTVGGSLTATSFHGSATGLTNIPAGQLTGALPTIDGSNLINVTASGTGVNVLNNQNTLGVAGTFDFSSGINANFGVGISTISVDPHLGLTQVNVSGVGTIATLSSSNLSATSLSVGVLGLTINNSSIGNNGSGNINWGTGNFYFNGSSGVREIGWTNGDGRLRVTDEFNRIKIVGGNGGTGQELAEFQAGGVVELFYAGTNPGVRLRTTEKGIYFPEELVYAPVGIVSAYEFVGSAVGLTSIPAAQLTGSLPAIDGSNLIGVIASGTGIEIKDSDSVVGSAGTVNFGDGLTVSPVSAGVVTVTASGGSLQSRTIVSASTTSIADDAVGFTTAAGFKSYTLMKVGVSTAAWIRIYTDSTSRANDSSRSVGEDPSPGSGVIAEVVTTGISTQQMITPFAMGGNMDDPVSNVIYLAIKNLSGSTQTITANLTILQLEAQ